MAVADYIAQATLLDAGTGANTGPPPSAGWAAASYSTATSQLQRVSNVIRRGGAGWGSAYWGTDFTADQIVMVTVTAVGDFDIVFCGKDEGSSAWDGYYLEYISASHAFDFYEVLNGSSSASLAGTTSITLSAGHRVAVLRLGNDMAAAVDTGSGFGADFLTASDATYTAGGSIGLWANGTTPNFNNFSGGNVTVGGGDAPASVFVPTKMLMGVGI